MNKQIPFLDLSQIPLDLKISLKEKFSQMLDKGVFSGGEEVEILEKNLKEYLGINHALACSNGTDALELALRALEIGSGDEVIVPALSWVSTAEAVVLVGAKPVFIDTDASGLMDLDLLESKKSSRTKAIIPVHLYGNMVDMEKLLLWSKKNKVAVIEDGAQSFGAVLKGKHAGTWGDIGCLSFYPTKNLGALGEAGAVLTEDSNLAEKLRHLLNHGQTFRDHHILVGRNARIDSIQAGFLNVKLGFFNTWQKKRKNLASIYLDGLKNIVDLTLPYYILEPNHNAHLFTIQTSERDKLKSFLEKNGIGTAIHYPTIIPKMLPYLDGKEYQSAENLSKGILSLPLNSWMNEDDILSISIEIKRFFEKA
jgi:UDP-2-acetamido-2-deoxy-ribo-hexuluronate aminotransferase